MRDPKAAARRDRDEARKVGVAHRRKQWADKKHAVDVSRHVVRRAAIDVVDVVDESTLVERSFAALTVAGARAFLRACIAARRRREQSLAEFNLLMLRGRQPSSDLMKELESPALTDDEIELERMIIATNKHDGRLHEPTPQRSQKARDKDAGQCATKRLNRHRQHDGSFARGEKPGAITRH